MLLEQRAAVKAANLHLYELVFLFFNVNHKMWMNQKHKKTVALTFRQEIGIYFRGFHRAITISPISLCITRQCKGAYKQLGQITVVPLGASLCA